MLNTQFISELQNDLYQRIMAGCQSDMHGPVVDVKKTLTGHRVLTPIPVCCLTILRPKKSEFEPAIAITTWENGISFQCLL